MKYRIPFLFFNVRALARKLARPFGHPTHGNNGDDNDDMMSIKMMLLMIMMITFIDIEAL